MLYELAHWLQAKCPWMWEAVEELKTKAAQNIINALTGVAPVYPVNKL